MSRQFFLSGVVTTICLFSWANEGAAQLTGGNPQSTSNTGGLVGASQAANAGGLIGGNQAANTGGGLIGTGGQTNANQGVRAQAANFQDLSAAGGGAAAATGRGGRTTRQFGGTGRGRGTGGGAARGGGQVQSTRRVIRPVLRIAFTYPTLAPRVESSLNRQFNRISIRLKNRFQYLALKAGDKGVVTLTGTVQSEGDKKLAAAYVRLEPGVRKIENNLTVVASTR